MRKTICSLSGLIILQHLTALLPGEDAAPQRAEASSFRRKGMLALFAEENGSGTAAQGCCCTADVWSYNVSYSAQQSAVANPPAPPCPLLPCDRAQTTVQLLSTAPEARRGHIPPPGTFLCPGSISPQAAVPQRARQTCLKGTGLFPSPLAFCSSRIFIT